MDEKLSKTKSTTLPACTLRYFLNSKQKLGNINVATEAISD